VVREKEKVEKARQVAEPARQRETQSGTKTPQLPQKGKRKTSQASSQTKKRQKRVVAAAVVAESSGGASASPPTITRYGRNVKLPDRYK
jgi:hypothetical protein